MEKTIRHTPEEIARKIEELAESIHQRKWTHQPVGFLGIANGGIPLAHALQKAYAKLSGKELPVGVIDVVFSRDDISTTPIPKTSQPTEIPFSLDGETIILVDDVLFSGRTVRAALDELFSHGRPSEVVLATLFDRGGRKLPIQADFNGFREEVPPDHQVKVHIEPESPENHSLRIFPTSQP
ncbi:MAG: bifunctional pyr operon transcriptional regulator/uracil phosphoribosyltransferase PyrR [Opitutales bacterium]|nr:bifunctional pyr operon transcriptional regulator/uracil phosphoribosyltransferase PyrR [Opitutales bacterium]MCH8539215.1 bifunctional pyr operon transcriptional regulator/uracil phosphoribosyltransferase PyrR [Opitutales bacterium]